MARKPAHLTMKKGRSNGRQAMWEAMRRLKRFTFHDVAAACAGETRTARSYIEALMNGGYVIEIEPQPRLVIKRRFELVKDIGAEAPRLQPNGAPCIQGLAREQMWRSMKLLLDFTWRDLAVTSGTEVVPVTEMNARDYIKHLYAAGYLQMTSPGLPTAPARYRFIKAMNTGPKPPMVQRTKVIFDPNLGRIMWQEEAGE